MRLRSQSHGTNHQAERRSIPLHLTCTTRRNYRGPRLSSIASTRELLATVDTVKRSSDHITRLFRVAACQRVDSMGCRDTTVQVSGNDSERLRRVLELQCAADGPQDAETLRSGIVLLRRVRRKLLPRDVKVQRHLRRHGLRRTIRVPTSPPRYYRTQYLVRGEPRVSK